MKAYVIALSVAALLVLAGCNRQPSQEVNTQPATTSAPSATVRPNEIEINKDNDTLMKPVKKPINVKLKRDFKGEYSWDIVGTDVKEIIKINRELQKEFPN
ncbi:hypothetical protein [Candidatus Magnetominusculus dajiuhuensis]|uniref:hypothetical protein n=1 Tax=Candidatus Magnetominusculus dajiuhuensis TaxID=3137712 RepID=UPI003B4389B6